MNKDEFETMLGRLREALEDAERLLAEAKLEYGKASARFKDAKRMHDAHLSWGRSMKFVEEVDIIDDVVEMAQFYDNRDIAKQIGVTGQAVSGALRRAVAKGLLVKTEDGYARV